MGSLSIIYDPACYRLRFYQALCNPSYSTTCYFCFADKETEAQRATNLKLCAIVLSHFLLISQHICDREKFKMNCNLWGLLFWRLGSPRTWLASGESLHAVIPWHKAQEQQRTKKTTKEAKLAFIPNLFLW